MKTFAIGCRIGLGTAAVAVLSFLPAGAAAAQTQACSTYPAMSCPPPVVTPPVNPNDPGHSGVEAAVTSTSLAFTGTDVVELGGIGLGAIGLGMVLVRRSRTRQTSD